MATDDYLLEEMDGIPLEDRGDKTAISEQHTNTWLQMYNMAALGTAQNAYQILQSNNVFENKDFLAADEFVDTNGTNNTVDTDPDETTAFYNSTDDNYELGFVSGFATSPTINDDWANNPTDFYDGDFSTYSSESTATDSSTITFYESTFAAQGSSKCRVKWHSFRDGGGAGLPTSVLEAYNGSSWVEIGTRLGDTNSTNFNVDNFDIGFQPEGIRFRIETGSSGDWEMRVYEFEFLPSTSSVLVCDTGLTLTGDELSLAVYGDKDLPTDTDITFDATDGTNTVTNKSINSIAGITDLTAGSLTIIFNFSTANTSVTPTLKGWGLYIK